MRLHLGAEDSREVAAVPEGAVVSETSIVVAAEDRLPSTERVEVLIDKARDYIRRSRSGATRRAYESAQHTFMAWCAEIGVPSLPLDARIVALYAAHLADSGYSWSTINVHLAGLDHGARQMGHPSVRRSREVLEVCEGIRRVHGTAFEQAKPITIEILRRMVDVLKGKTAVRDRAMLLLGFCGAFRRSELVALQVEDLTREENGYLVLLRQSKTDQTGEGFVKGIPFGGRASTCPVRALDAWLQARAKLRPNEAQTGPLFVAYSAGGMTAKSLSDQSVNSLVKNTLLKSGIDPKDYSGHSLRAGFVTSAAKAGKRLDIIMRQTGHKQVNTVMRYIRHVKLFEENPADGLGL